MSPHRCHVLSCRLAGLLVLLAALLPGPAAPHQPAAVEKRSPAPEIAISVTANMDSLRQKLLWSLRNRGQLVCRHSHFLSVPLL